MENMQQTPNQNTTIPITPTTEFPVSPPVPAAKTPWLIIALIIALIGVAGYFGYQNYLLKQQLTTQQPVPTPTIVVGIPTITTTPIPTFQLANNNPIPTASITITIDLTANWKTYTDSKYGFSFKYPSDLVIEEDDGGIGMSFVSKAEIDQPGGGSYFGFQYMSGYTISKYIDYVKKNRSAPDTQVTSEPLTISNNTFTLVKYTDAMDNRGEIVAQINNDLIIFSNNNQILSTFKFTK